MSVSYKTSLVSRTDHCLQDTDQRMRNSTMKPRIHVITLAVADLDQALAFYRDGLGFRTEGLIGTEFKGDETIPDGTTAVFHLDGGLMLSIYPRSELAKDAVILLSAAKPGEFSIGHAMASRGRRSHRTGQSSRSSRHRLTSRPAVGHLLGILPRSRRPPLGDHLEPRARPCPVLSGHDPSGVSTWEALGRPVAGPCPAGPC